MFMSAIYVNKTPEILFEIGRSDKISTSRVILRQSGCGVLNGDKSNFLLGFIIKVSVIRRLRKKYHNTRVFTCQ